MAHLFISYVREDKTDVDRLAADLESHGVDIWLDRHKIRPGTYWKDAVREAIKSGNFFIACFSAHQMTRDRSYMNTELSLAIDVLTEYPRRRAWFIPALLMGGEIPDRSVPGGGTLRDIQYVDLRSDWANGVDQILELVRGRREHARVHAQETLAQLLGLMKSNDQKGLRECLSDVRDIGVLRNAIDDEISRIIEDEARLRATRLQGWRDPHYRLEAINRNSNRLDQLRSLQRKVPQRDA